MKSVKTRTAAACGALGVIKCVRYARLLRVLKRIDLKKFIQIMYKHS